MAGEKAAWPDGWRWYRRDDGPFLANPDADQVITLPQLRAMLAFHKLDLCTEAERKVLEACAEEGPIRAWAENVWETEKARRELARRGGIHA